MLMLLTSSASAEKFRIESDGQHLLTREETIESAEDAAVNNALRRAVEQIGVRISAYSEVVNKVLKEDTVMAFASAVVKIQEKTLTPRIINGEYRIYSHLVCIVDSSDLDKWEPPDIERQRRLSEDKKRLEETNAKIKQEYDNVNRKYQEEKIHSDKMESDMFAIDCAIQSNGQVMSDFLRMGDEEYLKGNPRQAFKNWQDAKSMMEYGMERFNNIYMKACCRLAMVYWNSGNYSAFDNEIFNELRRFNKNGNGWYNALYADWLNPDTKRPLYSVEINIKKMIQDNKIYPSLSSLEEGVYIKSNIKWSGKFDYNKVFH